MLRATHEAAIARVESQRDTAAFKAAQEEQQRRYWQARAELFIDRASAKQGLTHEPVMRHAEGSGVPVEPFALNPFGGMGISIIDSSRTDGKAVS